MKTGIELIVEERKRQIEQEGLSPEHDAKHVNFELAIAAACYAVNRVDCVTVHELPELSRDEDIYYKDAFPWPDYDKRKKHGRLRSLVIAGALIAAECDRLLASEELGEKGWYEAQESFMKEFMKHDKESQQ
jgi:hypothetical protein